MRKGLEAEIKVGIFVIIGLVLMMVSIIGLGGTNTIFSRQVIYKTYFSSVDGMIGGAKVVLSGLQIGTVETIEFDSKSQKIEVIMKVNKKFEEWVRQNSTAEIATQG